MHDSIRNHQFDLIIDALELYEQGLSSKYNISLQGYFFTENVFILILSPKWPELSWISISSEQIVFE